MSAKATQTARVETADDQTGIKTAYEAVGEALDELDISEHYDQYCALQQQYFDLKAALLARDEEFQQMDLSGTEVHVPSAHNPVAGNPTTETEIGEVEVATRDGHFSVLDGVQVADPENPHVTKGVHIDHVIETNGDVRVEVNGGTIDELVSDD